MSKVIRVVGVLVLTILSISVPVFFGVSIVSHWNSYISVLLGTGTLVEICLVSIWIYFETEEK